MIGDYDIMSNLEEKKKNLEDMILKMEDDFVQLQLHQKEELTEFINKKNLEIIEIVNNLNGKLENNKQNGRI
jgi:hypothetical protein